MHCKLDHLLPDIFPTSDESGFAHRGAKYMKRPRAISRNKSLHGWRRSCKREAQPLPSQLFSTAIPFRSCFSLHRVQPLELALRASLPALPCTVQFAYWTSSKRDKPFFFLEEWFVMRIKSNAGQTKAFNKITDSLDWLFFSQLEILLGMPGKDNARAKQSSVIGWLSICSIVTESCLLRFCSLTLGGLACVRVSLSVFPRLRSWHEKSPVA